MLAIRKGCLTGKKLPNLGSNLWFSLPGSYPLIIRLLELSLPGSYPLTIRLLGSNSLMIRGYEPGREDQEFDPRLGISFLSDGKRSEE